MKGRHLRPFLTVTDGELSMNTRNTALFAALILVVFALTSTAGATATTHIWGPSTDVQPFKKIHITADMYLPTEDSKATNAPVPTVTNVGLTVGVLPFEKYNLEVGIDHKTGYGMLDRYPLYFNAKFGIPENAYCKYSPAIAVGILDLGTKSYKKNVNPGTNFNVMYGKVAKTLGPVGRISVGYFSGNKDLLLNAKGEKNNAGLMAAYERTMSEISDKLWLCAEYMGTNSAYGTLNFGAAWKFADNVAVLAGYDIYNEKDLNLPNTFTLQVDIDFDFPCCNKGCCGK
jgi:hypothetical protein